MRLVVKSIYFWINFFVFKFLIKFNKVSSIDELLLETDLGLKYIDCCLRYRFEYLIILLSSDEIIISVSFTLALISLASFKCIINQWFYRAHVFTLKPFRAKSSWNKYNVFQFRFSKFYLPNYSNH